jgi:hypothetical protein
MKRKLPKAETAYENRVVAFIDILGFKNLVANGKVSTILDALGVIRKRLKLIEDVRQSPLKASQFSDSVILSAPNDDNGLVHTIHFVSLLASELFLKGIWCRGAIASGNMHHEGNMAFGQALIDAMEMENQVAIYPRILVTESLADQFVNIKNANLPKWRRTDLAAYFRRDFDHLLHLDIFSYKMFVPPKTGTIKSAVGVVHRHIMNDINVTEAPSVMKIQAKLFWISTYLHYVEEMHGAWHFTISNKKMVVSSGKTAKN